MKTRWIALILCCALMAMCAPAMASSYNGDLPEQMFKNAMDALVLMSYGEYQEAIDILDFSENEPSADDFRLFAEAGLTMLTSGVQTEVAVACYTDDYGWILGVPLWKPDSMDIETFVLRSSDGATFDGYTSATWQFMDSLARKSSNVAVYRTAEQKQKIVVTD